MDQPLEQIDVELAVEASNSSVLYQWYRCKLGLATTGSATGEAITKAADEEPGLDHEDGAGA